MISFRFPLVSWRRLRFLLPWPDYTCYTRSRSLRWPTDLRKHTVRRWNRVVCWQRQQSRWRVYSVNEYFQTIQEIPKPPQILAKCKYFYSFDDPLSRRHREWERNRRSSWIHWFELIACFTESVNHWSLTDCFSDHWLTDWVAETSVAEALVVVSGICYAGLLCGGVYCRGARSLSGWGLCDRSLADGLAEWSLNNCLSDHWLTDCVTDSLTETGD